MSIRQGPKAGKDPIEASDRAEDDTKLQESAYRCRFLILAFLLDHLWL